MRRCLVVGGAGFIGSYLCKKLLENECFVVAYDNLMRGRLENIKSLLNNKNFVFIQNDANNVPFLKNCIKNNDIEYIFHLAANSDIQSSANEPQIEFDSTCSTTWSILKAMKETSVKNLFFASTSAVYGLMQSGKPFKEEDSLNPISYYGSSKVASEAFIRAFTYMNELNSLIFRFPNVIGPNLTHGVFYDFIQKLKANSNDLFVLGNGFQSKPYMYVEDLVNAVLFLVWDNKGFNVFNVGVESSTEVRTIANMIVKEMNLPKCTIHYGSENVGWKGDVPRFVYCLDKIHKCGWKATLTSDEASLKTIREALKA